MLWTPINYWPAMRLAFEIILALPALPFAAAIWVGRRERHRRTPEGKRFEPLISANNNLNPDGSPDFSPLVVKHPFPDSGPISVPLAVNPPHFNSEMP